MATTLNRTNDAEQADGAADTREEPPNRFAPPGIPSRYAAPGASIDPDTSKKWLQRAYPIMKAHRAMFLTALICSFIGLVIQVQIPQFLGEAINNSILTHKVPLSHYTWWVCGLAVVALIVGYTSRLFMFETAYRFEFDLRNIIYTHMTRMSFPFYDRVQSGQLISRANSDIRSVQMYMTFAPFVLVQCFMAVVCFVYMLRISVPLALVAMITLPPVFFVGNTMRKSLFPVSWIIQARLAEVATVVDENINGVRVVKSFAAEQKQLRTLARAADRVQWGYIKDADLRAKFTPLVQNLSQVGLASVLLFGGYMVIQDHGKSLGTIVSFNFWLIMMQAPFMMLGMIIMMGQRAAASSQRIYEILDEQPTIVDRNGAMDLVECRGEIDYRDVVFSYADGPPVLEHFDLHLDAGETVALVGRTGVGKSTVARLLTRFYDVNEGSVAIDGHDVRDVTLASLRSHVGVVLDEPFLFSVSVRDNIAYGRPDAPMDEIEAAARAAGAHGFISELSAGYDTIVGERGYTLSGGQRQRIAIARTLLLNPPVLVLDDATSAIDVHVEQQIHHALRGLMKGRTTLIIAHRLSTISLADRVVLLDGGRVVADGTHAELLATTPLYAEVLAQADESEKVAVRAGNDHDGSDIDINAFDGERA